MIQVFKHFSQLFSFLQRFSFLSCRIDDPLVTALGTEMKSKEQNARGLWLGCVGCITCLIEPQTYTSQTTPFAFLFLFSIYNIFHVAANMYNRYIQQCAIDLFGFLFCPLIDAWGFLAEWWSLWMMVGTEAPYTNIIEFIYVSNLKHQQMIYLRFTRNRKQIIQTPYCNLGINK